MASAGDNAVVSFTGEMGVTNADLGYKESAGSFTGEIGNTKAGNKEASGTFSSDSDIGVTKPWWLGDKDLAELLARREKSRQETADPVVPLVMKERVPDAYIQRIKTRPLRRMRPLKESIARNPKYGEKFLSTNARINYLVNLEQDCLRQYEKKEYAEVGVDYTYGFRKLFILPKQVV